MWDTSYMIRFIVLHAACCSPLARPCPTQILPSTLSQGALQEKVTATHFHVSGLPRHQWRTCDWVEAVPLHHVIRDKKSTSFVALQWSSKRASGAAIPMVPFKRSLGKAQLARLGSEARRISIATSRLQRPLRALLEALIATPSIMTCQFPYFSNPKSAWMTAKWTNTPKLKPVVL